VTSVLIFAHRMVDPLSSMTGIGRYVEHIIGALDRADHDGWRFDASSTREDGDPAWLPAGVRYRPVPGPRRPVHLAWTATHLPRIDWMVGEFDVLHALQPSFPLPTKRPAVLTVHDVMPMEHPEWYEPIERWGQRRTLRYAIDNGWHFIADSQYVADLARDLVGLPAERTTVVHLAVDDEFRRPIASERIDTVCEAYGVTRGRYLLTIGNVSTRKNVPAIVAALAQTEDRTLPLILAGRVHESGASVMADIERLGLGDRVRVPGFVPDDDMRVLLAGALALVHPSVDEGFGLPPLEGLAAGVPVVAARAGSVPEVVGDAGLLVDPRDTSAWAAAFSSVASDSDLCARLAAAGPARAAAFTWERTAAETMAVYQRAVGRQ
jgi:glycosyltransferase involved in cell wall biosynthesis